MPLMRPWERVEERAVARAKTVYASTLENEHKQNTWMRCGQCKTLFIVSKQARAAPDTEAFEQLLPLLPQPSGQA